jgi:hypothetical protein
MALVGKSHDLPTGRSRRQNSEMALPLIKTIRQDICLYRRFLVSSYFTATRIVMNNKSATVDETLAKNPYFEKYASKITTLQQYCSHRDCSSFIGILYYSNSCLVLQE